MLGMAIAGALGSAAGTALGNALGGNDEDRKLLDEAIFDLKSATNFKVGLYKQAAQVARQGAKFQSNVFKQAGDIAVLISNFNVAQEQTNLRRTEDALGRQISDVVSTNWATASGNGLSLNSKSTMVVQNEALNVASRQITQIQNDSRQKQASIQFQGLLTKMQYENQATAAEYSGELQALGFENQAIATKYEGDLEIYKIMMENPKIEKQSIGEAAALGAIRGLGMG
jgi:hypothetical protein